MRRRWRGRGRERGMGEQERGGRVSVVNECTSSKRQMTVITGYYTEREGRTHTVNPIDSVRWSNIQ